MNPSSRSEKAYLLFLSGFMEPQENYERGWFKGHTWEDWENALTKSPSHVVKRLRDDGLLEPCGLIEQMNHQFGMPNLKAMCKEHGLTISGKKIDLIRRLIETDNAAIRSMIGDVLLQCTPVGHQLAEQYLADERQRKQVCEDSILDALRKHEFKRAVKIVANYEASQVFSRGMGIDWTKDDPAGYIDLLDLMFTGKPKILDKYLPGLSEQELDQIRVAASMFALGRGTVGDVVNWLPVESDKDLSARRARAALDIHSYGVFKRQMRAIIETKLIEYTHVNGCNDDHVCAACRTLQLQEHIPIDQMPELPYEKCTSEHGCRCRVGVSLGPRRVFAKG